MTKGRRGEGKEARMDVGMEGGIQFRSMSLDYVDIKLKSKFLKW